MPTSSDHFSQGYEGGAKRRRRRGRGRVSPTGPYPAESGNKSVREKASPAERRKFSHGSSRTAQRARKLERKDQARAKREVAAAKSPAPRPVETLRRAEREIARTRDRKRQAELRESARRLRHALAAEAHFKANRKTPEGTAIDANKPDRTLKSVAPRAYKKALKAAEPGGHGSSKGLGEPEDLTTAITLAAPGSGLVGSLGRKAAQEGGRVVAKDLAEAAASKIEAKGSSVVSKTVNAGSAVRAGGRLAGRAALRAAGKDTSKLAEKAAAAAAKRAARRDAAAAAAERSKAASAAVPGIKAGKIGLAGTPAVRGHIEALVDNPKKTAKTTARALPGLVTVPVATVGKVAVTGGRAASTAAHDVGIPGAKGYSGSEILAPVKDIPKEQLDFAKQVARVLTSTDSKTVKKEVEDELGLTLPIMLGLGSKAAGEKISKGRVTEAVRRITERVREKHGKAHGYREGKTPRVLERTGQRKSAAKAAAQGRTRLRTELEDRQRPILDAVRGLKGSEVVRKGVARGKRGRKVDLKIHDADVVGFLQRHPMKLDDPVAMLAEVKRIKSQLKEPPKGMEPSPEVLSTRDVIAHIEKRPDILANPALIAAVRAYRRQGEYARKNRELAPEHSERARFLSAATTRRIPFPEERFPESVRAITRAAATRGKDAKDVLRREAHTDRRRARANRRKADRLEAKGAAMRRELETREKLNKKRLALGPTESQLRELEAVKAMERRGIVRPGQVGGHLRVVTDAKGKAPSATLAPPKLHDRIAERIDKIDAQVVDLRERAKLDEQMAAAKHKAASEVDPKLTDEFTRDVKQQLRAEGITELPEYQHVGTGRQHGAPVYNSSGSKLTQFPGKSKKRKGTAEEFGIVEEGLRPLIRESISRPLARRESYKAARSVIESNRFEPGGKKEWSAKEADELFRGADLVLSSDQWMKVPRQFYKRIYDVLEGKGKGKGITAEDFHLVGGLDAARKGEAKGSHYMIVRKAAMDELVDQLSNTLVAPKIARVNRATSFLILGTSPAWAAMQVIAEYGQAAVAQGKLLDPRFVKKAIRTYKEMEPAKRQAFDSWVGVTNRAIERAEDLKLDLKAGDMEAAASAYSTLERTPYGRFLKGIPTAIQRVDQWKGGRIRALTTLAKIDKDLNGRANLFLRGIGGLNREMGAALKEMKGKSLKEQAEWVADHPKWQHHYQGYLDDVLGNWSALTKNERVAAQAMIFYPFLRMSLRWTFYSFPKRHPVKAAILYGLGQQNAQEVKKLLGGDPSYFTQWAMVPIDLGGEKKLIDLSRIAPGSNALVEALGGSGEGPKGIAAAKVAQPALAALGTAIYGVSPLSGKQEAGSGWNALAQLLSLSPLSRVAGEATVPAGRKKGDGLGQVPIIGSFTTERQEALDKLSAKLREAGTPARLVRQLALPPLPKDAGKEADSALLGRVMKALGKNSSSARDDVSVEYATKLKNAVEEGRRHDIPKLKTERDERLEAMEAEYAEANHVLDKLFDKHKIPHKKEDALFLKFYGEGKYGTGKEEDNQFGLPATSQDALRKQFGLPSTSSEALKEQFGIK
jgi:hypothetical protein